MIELEDVKKVAELAAIKLNSAEAIKLQEDLRNVIEHFSLISEAEVDDLAPLITPIQLQNYLREDVVTKTNSVEESLRGAPESVGNLFKVPPVVG